MIIQLQQGWTRRERGDRDPDVLVLVILVEMSCQRIRSYLRDDEEADGLIELIVSLSQRLAESALT